jgi:hypothetical protein
LPETREKESTGNWMAIARTRLAQRRAEKPATKAGQIKALWPEIDAALAGGQSMKSIRKWLEEDAGITVGVTSLTSYISRLRRREKANRRDQAPALHSAPAQVAAEAASARLHSKPATAPPPDDPLAQAMRTLTKRPFDIRELHNDGDPTKSKLI